MAGPVKPRKIPLPARGNWLLDQLSEAEYERLLPPLKPVELEFEEILYEFRGPIDYAYFPTGAVTSSLTVMQDGNAIEVATVGNEGLVGHTAAFGGQTSPNKVIVQIGDGGLRIDVKVLRQEIKRSWLAPGTAGSLPQRVHGAGVTIGGLQRFASARAALLPLALDDARPGRSR